MKIPYGIADFGTIRERGLFYVDKTSFLPVLEEHHTYVVFLRPRRFGKSTLMSMMDHYYDVGRKARFDATFKGLWIHERPTDEQGRYLVMSLDFSSVATDQGQDVLRRSFLGAVRASVGTFLLRYRERAPALERVLAGLDHFQDAEVLLREVLGAVAATPYKVYLFIDEYDHFANRLLSAGEEGLYQSIIQKTGFVRTFYAAIKAGTGAGAVARMFVTGVSPLMLDDLSSGFNMATHASLSARLNTLAGFTRADTERAVDELLAAKPALAALPELNDREALLGILEEHYNGYRFSEDASERVFNADMVLYFLRELKDRGRVPRNMLDQNVRTEYRHLQRIGAVVGTKAAERRALMETILSEGRIRSPIVERFGVESLPSQTHFISLLYFLGMLTLKATPMTWQGHELEIPNRVIRELQWEHLAAMLHEEAGVPIGFDALQVAMGAMANDGDIAPFLDLFQRDVLEPLSNRDTRGLDEKTLKLLMMTYASLSRAFYVLSEKEFAQGYSDLFLGASQGANFSWLLELKYLKAGAKPAQIEAAFSEAAAQVERYAGDQTLLPLLVRGCSLKAGTIVFIGVKKVLFRPWEPGAKPKRSSAPRPPRKRAKGR